MYPAHQIAGLSTCEGRRQGEVKSAMIRTRVVGGMGSFVHFMLFLLVALRTAHMRCVGSGPELGLGGGWPRHFKQRFAA